MHDCEQFIYLNLFYDICLDCDNVFELYFDMSSDAISYHAIVV